MANRHRGTDTDRAMRSRQVAEALGEDARAAQKAFLLNFPFVQQSKEEFLRPDELDRKTAFELAGFLDKMASSLSQAVSAMAIPAEAGKLTQGISEYLSAYNRATAYVRLYGTSGKLSSREEQAIQMKFDSVKPSLEQILNAHAAGTPIPEFRAVLESYDNISNNDLRPVSFSPPINIPQPPQPAGQQGAPALPIPPIVGPNVQRQPQPAPPALPAPVQPAPAAPPPPQPPAMPQLVMPLPLLQAAQAPAMNGWLVNNPQQGVNNQADRRRFYQAEVRRFRNYNADLAQYQADLAAYQQQFPAVGAPAQQPAPVAPQQPDPADQRQQALNRADTNLIRELEGNRLAVAAAEAALQGQPRNRDRIEALATAQRKFRRAEERALRAGVANIPYDPTMGAPKPPRVGDGAYGGVSANMAGMDDEYLDLTLHDGFQDRGNWSGMMRALQGMPTNPYGAGIEMEEGAEMPYGTFGSAKRVAFVPDEDYISSEEEPEDEMEDDDMYDREIAGRQQLDDEAEKIQANRLSKELKTAKGGARNMRDMLDKLRGKIKCR
jgi:hypothetical protein